MIIIDVTKNGWVTIIHFKCSTIYKITLTCQKIMHNTANFVDFWRYLQLHTHIKTQTFVTFWDFWSLDMIFTYKNKKAISTQPYQDLHLSCLLGTFITYLCKIWKSRMGDLLSGGYNLIPGLNRVNWSAKMVLLPPRLGQPW